MSRLRTAFVLGYHGCEKEVAERLLAGTEFERSEKDFDWLGPGAYFWESDPERALDWALNRSGSRSFDEPYVVGAVIDLGNCLDLTTRGGIELAASAFDSFKKGCDDGGLSVPVNEDLASDPHNDRLLRKLDCAVIKHLHENIEDESGRWSSTGGGPSPQKPFDTVRGMFPEGGVAFSGSGFLAKTHTQIAVLTPDSIKGVFRLRPVPPALSPSGT